jgi:hypothetical protein
MEFLLKADNKMFRIEKELREISVFSLVSDDVNVMMKNGMSARYTWPEDGLISFKTVVPIEIRFYRDDIDSGEAYIFDASTGVFTKFIKSSSGCTCVSMDKRSITKYKDDADNYYNMATNMLREVTNGIFKILQNQKD